MPRNTCPKSKKPVKIMAQQEMIEDKQKLQVR